MLVHHVSTGYNFGALGVRRTWSQQRLTCTRVLTTVILYWQAQQMSPLFYRQRTYR